MILAVEEVTKAEEMVRVPGLGFLDKSAAEKLSDIFQVDCPLIDLWCTQTVWHNSIKKSKKRNPSNARVVYIMLQSGEKGGSA